MTKNKQDKNINNADNEQQEDIVEQEEQCSCADACSSADSAAGCVDDDLQKLYAQLQAEKNTLDEQMLRLQADFDNFRKRTRAEKESWRNLIIGDMAAALLPVLDNFSHAMRAMEKDETAKKHYTGVTMILRQLQETLKNYGVEEICADVGIDFDPAWHNAVGFTETDDAEQDGKIAELLMKGYKVGDKLLRPATVKVYKQA